MQQTCEPLGGDPGSEVASKYEVDLAASLKASEIAFKWQETGGIPRLPYHSLYGVTKWADPDFYLEVSGLSVEVKGSMTLHQVTKMLFLCAQPGARYYVYQASEEDWDPTLDSFVSVLPAPDSSKVAARRAFNLDVQRRELIFLARHPEETARAASVTARRLRHYVNFFEANLVRSTGMGLLGGEQGE